MQDTLKNVVVLMSTYNGIKYIAEQVRSVYEQEGVSVRLKVRDDGSTDGTQAFLEKEQEAGRLTWYSGPNLGAARSFWHLLSEAPEADFYAFSDQDDVWDKDKLRVAVEQLSTAGMRPSLYFCRTRLVDEKLRELPGPKTVPLLTYGESLVYQMASGCTMVFNDALRRVLAEYTPAYMRMHDMWIYEVAQAVGAAVYFDTVPHISYRQHAGNVVGESDSVYVQWRKRLCRIRKGERIRSRTAEELWKGYAGSMSTENRELTRRVMDCRKSLSVRLSLFFSRRLRCADPVITFTSRVAILCGMF